MSYLALDSKYITKLILKTLNAIVAHISASFYFSQYEFEALPMLLPQEYLNQFWLIHRNLHLHCTFISIWQVIDS